MWLILCLAVKKFLQINGTLAAGAFAHYAFFSLFPMILLFVTVASVFIDRAQAGAEVIAFVKSYVPITGEMQAYIFNTIAEVVNARGPASVLAMLTLVWSAMQFFTTLITASNQAWGEVGVKWWRLPAESLVFLAIMVAVFLLGVTLPVLADMLESLLFSGDALLSWFKPVLSAVFSPLLVFFSLSLFYRLAPSRPTRFAEVWVGALCTTVLLQAAGALFIIYLEHFAALNAVYGAFGAIMALLLWIYLSGCIFIFGACLCAVQAQSRSSTAGVFCTKLGR
jgi:Ca2+-transporting ATPase